MTVTEEPAVFDTLIYTDCVPGQGLAGTAGLQFQARSRAADREAMAVVQRSLLYEPPTAWMRARRPVEDYPPSFAHVFDGLYATASGVYLGREANGGREGNQLTHSIVTRSPESYGMVRPAQLFQAPFWTDHPEPTTTCAPIGAHWEAGPFDAAAAQEFVRAQPRGEQWLVALLSAVDRVDTPDGKRVLFIAEDAAAVLHWVVAATILIPQRKALAIGLKVFTTNPAYAPQPVVAVHPAWGVTSASVDNDSGYVVFDLTSGECSEVEASDQAERRVRLFLERDPYDVLDLVEVAALVGLSPSESLDLGIAMVMPDGKMREAVARLAVRWLRGTDPGLLASYRGTLVDRLAGGVERWPRDILVDLDQVAVGGQVPADRVAPVRLALIRAELDRVLRDPTAQGVPLTPLRPDVWHGEHRRAAEDLVVRVLRAGVVPPVFDAVLRVAKRLGVNVRLAEVPEAVGAFITDWADHPRQPYHKAEWDNGEELEGELRDELCRRVKAGDGERVGAAWWERFEPGLETITTDLDRAILGAAIQHGPADLRAKLIDSYIRGAVETGKPALVATVADWLFNWTLPTDDELRLLCRLLPKGPALQGRLFERLAAHLTGAAQLSPDVVELTRELVERGLYHVRRESDVHRLLLVDGELRRVCRELPSKSDAHAFSADVTLVKTAEQRLRTLWAERIAAALLTVDRPQQVEQMLAVLPGNGYVTYVGRLIRTVQGKPDVPRLATALYLSWSKAVRRADQDRLREVLVKRRRLKALTRAVDELGGPWPGRWKKTLEAADAKRPGLVRRIFGGKG